MDVGEAKLLRMEEVVTITGLSRAKVYAMAASGDLPAIRAGRSVRRSSCRSTSLDRREHNWGQRISGAN